MAIGQFYLLLYFEGRKKIGDLYSFGNIICTKPPSKNIAYVSDIKKKSFRLRPSFFRVYGLELISQQGTRYIIKLVSVKSVFNQVFFEFEYESGIFSARIFKETLLTLSVDFSCRAGGDLKKCRNNCG